MPFLDGNIRLPDNQIALNYAFTTDSMTFDIQAKPRVNSLMSVQILDEETRAVLLNLDIKARGCKQIAFRYPNLPAEVVQLHPAEQLDLSQLTTRSHLICVHYQIDSVYPPAACSKIEVFIYKNGKLMPYEPKE